VLARVIIWFASGVVWNSDQTYLSQRHLFGSIVDCVSAALWIVGIWSSIGHKVK